MSQRPVIFLSAVSRELKTARGFAARLLHSMGYDPKDQDMARAEHGELRGVLRRWIDQSAGVIQLVGHRYGAEPREADTEFGRCSYTQYEALYAKKTGKPVWYFFVGDGFTGDVAPGAGAPSDPEPDELRELQRAYRERIRATGDLRHTFASDAELEVSIRRIENHLDELHRAWRDEQRRTRRFRTFACGALAVLLALGIASVRLGWWASKDAVEIKENTRAMLAAMRELSGTLAKTGAPGKPEDEAPRLAAAYAELEKKHGLPPGTLARELPRFAEQILARADTPQLDRASALFAAKKFAEAETEALAAKDRALAGAGPPVRDAIAALSLAGDSARQQIHRGKALEHYRAAAAFTSESRSPLEWVGIQWRIASTLDEDGKAHEAEEIWQRIIPVCAREKGAEHPDTLSIRSNLAVALHEQGKYTEADAEHRAVLAVRGRVLGAEHPDTLSSRSNLAAVLHEQGRNAEAEAEHRAVFALRVRALGAEHPDTLSSRNNLANALHAQGRHAEAEVEHRAVVAARKRVLGTEHPDTLASRSNLASALGAQRKYAGAEAEHRAVLAIVERVLGAEHPDAALSCYNLSLCLEARAKAARGMTDESATHAAKAEALAFARRALAIWKKALGDVHPLTGRAQAQVADLEKP